MSKTRKTATVAPAALASIAIVADAPARLLTDRELVDAIVASEAGAITTRQHFIDRYRAADAFSDEAREAEHARLGFLVTMTVFVERNVVLNTEAGETACRAILKLSSYKEGVKEDGTRRTKELENAWTAGRMRSLRFKGYANVKSVAPNAGPQAVKAGQGKPAKIENANDGVMTLTRLCELRTILINSVEAQTKKHAGMKGAKVHAIFEADRAYVKAMRAALAMPGGE
jgi:hypothetical protein